MMTFDDEYVYFHNKYTKYYNNLENNPISVLADFEIIVSGLEERKKEKLAVIKYNISELVVGTFQIEDIDIFDHVSERKKFKNRINELHSWAGNMYLSDITSPIQYQEIEGQLIKWLIDIYGLIEPFDEDLIRYNFELDLDVIEWFKEEHKEIIKIGWNATAIARIINKIKDYGYPERLKFIGEMSESEIEDVLNEIEVTKRGNPDFRDARIDMPEGFYQRADEIKKESPEKSRSWIENKLIREFLEGDRSKKSTVGRRLRKYWKN